MPPFPSNRSQGEVVGYFKGLAASLGQNGKSYGLIICSRPFLLLNFKEVLAPFASI
jgi:hypothetical protein